MGEEKKHNGEPETMNEKYETIQIENEYFCEDCDLRHKITQKAIEELISIKIPA